MKKCMSILLVCFLILSVTSAGAESLTLSTDSGFGIQVAVPEGYTVHQLENAQDMPFNMLTFIAGDPEAISMTLTVAYDEEYAGLTLNDLDDDNLNLLMESLTVDMFDPDVSPAETAYGTKLIVVNENSDRDEYVLIATVYQGYWIELLLEKEDKSIQLTREEIDLGISLLSNTWFVEQY